MQIQTAVLAPYYFVFDLLLSVMTPLMFTAAGAMVVLDEADLGLARAIALTPVGRRGYLASRIGVPAVISTVYCAIISLVFRLSDIDIPRLLLLAVCSGVLSITAALMIVAMAKNGTFGISIPFPTRAGISPLSPEVSRNLNRRYIEIELNADYCALARAQIGGEKSQSCAERTKRSAYYNSTPSNI